MTDVEYRDIVIGAIRGCLKEHEDRHCPYDCPYRDDDWREKGDATCRAYNDDNISVPTQMLTDALALLETRKPRLMTPEDFENNPDVDKQGRLPCWVEYKDDYGGWSFVCKWEIEDADRHRFWTSRPTDAQMEAIPWAKM